MRVRTFSILLSLSWMLGQCLPTPAQSNGIFADFQTSMGDFTCRLDFTNAPMTVANFVGLAAGERNWLDLETGKIERRPFYDGLTFHRVLPSGIIQTGSRNGQGTDGPRYTFPDEFSTNLLHDVAGVLSMANSGLNANGSQVFVTLIPTPGLDFKHSVFGHVTSGLNVVQAIGTVAVDGNDKPLTPIDLQQVVIRREGTAAQQFNIHAQNLPEIQPATLAFSNTSTGLEVRLPVHQDHEYWLYSSATLSSWGSQRLALYVDPPGASNLVLGFSGVSPQLNLHIPDVMYPGPLFTPDAARGRDFLLQLNNTFLLLININPSGGGMFQFGTVGGPLISSGSFSESLWSQQAYRGTLWIPNPTSPTIKFDFAFSSADGGFARGTYLSSEYLGPFVTAEQ